MSGTSSVMLLVRVVLSLGIVIGLMMIAGRILARRSIKGFRFGRGARPEIPIEVVAQQAIGRHGAVCVVRIGDRHLVLGTTEHAIHVLADASADELVPAVTTIDTAALSAPAPSGTKDARAGILAFDAPGSGGSPRMKLLDALRDRTVRHC